MGVNFDLLALNSDQRMREPHLTLSLPSIITHKIMIKLHTGKYSFDLTIFTAKLKSRQIKNIYPLKLCLVPCPKCCTYHLDVTSSMTSRAVNANSILLLKAKSTTLVRCPTPWLSNLRTIIHANILIYCRQISTLV